MEEAGLAGCGPGTVTLPLAPPFEAVISLDSDPEMLACASRAAARRGIGNATWIQVRTGTLLRPVTGATSHPWTEQ